jgi:Zn-dependent protease
MFKFAGMQVIFAPSSLIGSALLLIVFTLLASTALQLTLIAAVLWGAAAVFLYWLSETLHQYGHFIAARRTGYPMNGVRLWWIFGASQYPADEPELPAAIHIRRALGGAPVSIGLGIFFGVLALLLQNSLSLPLWGLLALFAGVNLFFFGLGAFIPFGFTDGGTLLRYRRKS